MPCDQSHLLIPHLPSFISTIYTELVTQWFKIKWLRFTDNHEETFLILNSDITDYLTVQTAIDQNCFVNTKSSLRDPPECVLIRTEMHSRSLLLPNSMISLEHLLDRPDGLCLGKLIAIICNETTSKIMFYKACSSDRWYIFYNDQRTSSQSYSHMLSDEQQLLLESVMEQHHPQHSRNFIQPSELPYPLSALSNHPISFVYMVQRIS